MKNVALAAALAASFASSSHAMTTEIDTDGDGYYGGGTTNDADSAKWTQMKMV